MLQSGFEYVMSSEGKLYRRDYKVMELEVTQAAIDGIGSSIVRKTLNAFMTKDWGMTHIAQGGDGHVYLTTEIKRIPLRAPFKLSGKEGEQFLIPVFDSKTEETLSLEWKELAGMTLLFLQMCKVEPSASVPRTWTSVKAWLFAADNNNRHFKLPLPNIYDDCRVCEGDWQRYASSAQESVTRALAQFEKSEWNADLWRDPAASQKMFRFMPKKEGFDQMPPQASDWTQLCVKVSLEISKYAVNRRYL